MVLTGRSNVFSDLQRPDPSLWEDGAAAVNRVFLSFLPCPHALLSALLNSDCRQALLGRRVHTWPVY